MSVTKKKLKKGMRWKAEIWIKGVKVKSRMFDTASEAHYWHDSTKKAILSGKYVSQMTLSECVKEYKETEFQLLRLQSRQSRESRFTYLLDSPISQVNMDELNVHHMDDWLKWLRNHPTTENKNRKSFTHELKLLTVIFNWYRETKDPSFFAPILKRHRKQIFYKPIEPRRPDYFIKEHEIKPWLDAMKLRPDPIYHKLAKFMLLTGWRLGESAGLSWKGVNFKNRTVRVVQTMWWDYKTKQSYIQNVAKNETSFRFSRLPDTLIEMLEEMKKEATGDLVFLNKSGKMLKDNTIRDNFLAGFKHANLDWSGSHINRHTFSTLGLKVARDKPGLQASLGHSSGKQTDGYAKIIYLQDNEISDKLASYLGI